jgi:hypothetical protein
VVGDSLVFNLDAIVVGGRRNVRNIFDLAMHESLLGTVVVSAPDHVRGMLGANAIVVPGVQLLELDALDLNLVYNFFAWSH